MADAGGCSVFLASGKLLIPPPGEFSIDVVGLRLEDRRMDDAEETYRSMARHFAERKDLRGLGGSSFPTRCLARK